VAQWQLPLTKVSRVTAATPLAVGIIPMLPCHHLTSHEAASSLGLSSTLGITIGIPEVADVTQSFTISSQITNTQSKR
jgi:hypothetical protein